MCDEGNNYKGDGICNNEYIICPKEQFKVLRILVVVIGLFFTNFLTAQLSVDIMIGVNYKNLNFENYSEYDLEDRKNTYSASARVNLRLNPIEVQVGIRTRRHILDLSYASKGRASDNYFHNWNIDYAVLFFGPEAGLSVALLESPRINLGFRSYWGQRVEGNAQMVYRKEMRPLDRNAKTTTSNGIDLTHEESERILSIILNVAYPVNEKIEIAGEVMYGGYNGGRLDFNSKGYELGISIIGRYWIVK